MSFLQRLKMSLMNFMQGRHGADNLGMFTLLTGLAFSLLGSFTGFGILSILGTVLYFLTIFRNRCNFHRVSGRLYLFYTCLQR